jgi:transcriptional regulator with XRE-family HTH domain
MNPHSGNTRDLFAAQLGPALKHARQKAGLSQAELAERLRSDGFHVTQGYISLIESGKRTEISAGLLLALHLLIGLEFTDLLGDDPPSAEGQPPSIPHDIVDE